MAADGHEPVAPPICPFSIQVGPIAKLVNCELADHRVYDGLELQYLDDRVHGTGMLAFLSRRADGRVDYYLEEGLTLDRRAYEIGSGIGEWRQIEFEAAKLEIGPDGLFVDVQFRTVDEQVVEMRVDDRDGRPRRRASLLAPVSAGIMDPSSMMLVYLRGFDLVRAVGPDPVVRIDGEDASTGRLPGRWLHRRHLIKYAAPLSAVIVNPAHDGSLAPIDLGNGGRLELAPLCGISGLTDRYDDHETGLRFYPPFPDLAAMTNGEHHEGSWTIDVDDAPSLTSGRWTAVRQGSVVELTMTVTQRWRPKRLPLLMAVVTRVVPTFRRWPTSYRWSATVTLGDQPTMTSRWQRTGGDDGDAYRRTTGSHR